MKIKNTLICLGILLPSITQAATITWGSATAIGTTTDVSTNGILNQAINTAHNGQNGVMTTVNGVTFTGAGNFFNNNNATDLNPNDLAGDVAYDNILSNFDFQSGAGGTSASINVGVGLIAGETYEIQAWFVDDRLNQDARTMTVSDGVNPGVTLNDEFVIGTFVADGTGTQTLQIVGDDGSGGAVNAHFSAFQVRLIPEPSTTLLFGLSGLALLGRRKRS